MRYRGVSHSLLASSSEYLSSPLLSYLLSMDTISRENNSMLPVGGIIVGVIGLLLGGYSAISLSKVNKTLADHQVKVDKVDAIEAQAAAAGQAAEKGKADLASLTRTTQDAFNQVGPALAALREDVTKIQDAMKKPV